MQIPNETMIMNSDTLNLSETDMCSRHRQRRGDARDAQWYDCCKCQDTAQLEQLRALIFELELIVSLYNRVCLIKRCTVQTRMCRMTLNKYREMLTID